ncbi:MAG: sigma 54-interacting transcriptional regulator [Peptococcaceae bacterium]|nr:sigma 54-interacting transcriptional regulator [Peptococcaceae bacterium]
MVHREGTNSNWGLRGDVPADRLLQAIFNNRHEGLVVVDSQGVIGQISESLVDVLQKSQNYFIGRPISETCPYFRRIARVLRTGSPEFGKIQAISGKSVMVDYIPITDHGEITGALAKVTFLSPQYPGEKRPAAGKGRNKISGGHGYGVKYNIDNILGSSPQMIDLKETLLKIAPRNSNVLITGESGTGKELFAQAIHAASLRRAGPFVKINCAAIPENLLESEFFGYEEGAFTGSKKGGQAGKLELADKGTVFLDEIGELPFTLQAKLLRFIQDGEIQKLGSGETFVSDVRIVAATNVNLEQLVKYRKFREDLYYRLNVVNLNIPPLRERREDITLLVDHFIDKFNRLFKFKVAGVSPEVKTIMHRYSWPGNVRELQNVIERAFNILEGNIILPSHLPSSLLKETVYTGEKADHPIASIASALNKGQTLEEIMDQMEKLVILQALMISHGNKAKTAQLLNISRPGLYKKMSKLGLT